MTTAIRPQVTAKANPGTQVSWGDIQDPGTYYSNWSGHLIRVPPHALKDGFSPVIEIVGEKPMFVTKLSEDPYLCISKARMIAADLDLNVSF
jgi:hypothetical protein